MDVKPKRSVNWSQQEKSDLLNLISNKIAQIENKKTDFQANSAKNQAWAEVHLKFKATYGEVRTIKCLKDQWKRTKQAAKKEMSSWKAESTKTGGGPAPPPLSDMTQTISRLCPREFNSMSNKFDDDAGISDGLTPEEFLSPTLTATSMPCLSQGFEMEESANTYV